MPADNGRALSGVPDGATIGEGTMTVYSGPVFDMAVNQFGVIANHLEIPMDERDRILLPLCLRWEGGKTTTILRRQHA